MTNITPNWYNNKISINCSINGYEPEDLSFQYDLYLKVLDEWQDKIVMTFDEFFKKYDSTVCSDWAKMDRNGNYYGGYWLFPEDSPERRDAYSLSYKDNAQALFELPYPKNFILLTTRIGCLFHRESVKFTNSFCEYMKKRVKQNYNYIIEESFSEFIKEDTFYSMTDIISDYL